MITKELHITNDIMTTDFYVAISGNDEAIIQTDLKYCETRARDFAKAYARFVPDSELSKMNEIAGEVKVSRALYAMLKLSQIYFKKTEGIFDPAILPALYNQGYNLSKAEGYVDKQPTIYKPQTATVEKLKLKANYTIEKPQDLQIDLGGIGKGYLIQELVDYLSTKYKNFCVSIGGDMYVGGKDTENEYDYWAIEIQNPTEKKIEMPTLMLSDLAVATSGVNKRKWNFKNKMRNHIIDTRNYESVENDLMSVTVISESIIEADIYAKTLLVLGAKDGLECANARNLNAIFVTKESKIFYGYEAQKYVWQDR